MKIINYGSLNLDFVYTVEHIVRPGETISSRAMEVFPGGKGLNQSVALARAEGRVFHAGLVGADGQLLIQTCADNGVDCTHIRTVEERTGNAIIQVDTWGQNSIVLFGGANRRNKRRYVDQVLDSFGEGDLLLLQNEVSLPDYIMERARGRGLQVAMNPSPCDEAITACDLGYVDIFLLNEIEGEQITGKRRAEEILEELHRRYPRATVVLTLGEQGAVCLDKGQVYRQAAFSVPVVDTTAAGDTFTGYYLASRALEGTVPESLRTASAASALAVSRWGAAPSIPWRKEVENFLREKTV